MTLSVPVASYNPSGRHFSPALTHLRLTGTHDWMPEDSRSDTEVFVAIPNLTQERAVERAGLLEVDSYTVDLDLTDDAGKASDVTFRTTTAVRFSCRIPGTSSWIDLVAARVSTATLNGATLDVAGYDEADGVALPALAATNELVVEADGRYMNTGEGLHRFTDPVDGSVYLYSQFQTADAKRMYACFDQPDLKAVHRLRVVAP